jgi:TM2 domain-containing membrane protein YozV
MAARIAPALNSLVCSAQQVIKGKPMTIPYALQAVFQSLPANTQALVWRDYEVRKKSCFFAYFFWFFFGFHYLYLGRIGIQLIYWLTFGGFGLWMFIDLFRIPGMVERKNEDIARELMAQYQALRVG